MAPEESSPETGSIFDILSEESALTTTGSRTPTSMREAPTSVWIIDRQTIERSGALNLGDILRLVPGIQTREIGPGFTESHVRFPFFDPDNQTLVLIDGRSLQFDAYGMTDKSALDLFDIERIEVLVGPASTLYGTNAFSGVINIITRRAAREGTHFRLWTRQGLATGSNGLEGSTLQGPKPMGTAFSDVSHGWGSGALRLSIGVEYLPSFGTAALPGTQPDVTDARRVSGSADVEQDVGGWRLRARAFGYARQAMFVVFATSPMTYQDYSLSLNATRENLFFQGDELSIAAWGRYLNYDLDLAVPYYGSVPFDAKQGSGEALVSYRSPCFFKNQLARRRRAPSP